MTTAHDGAGALICIPTYNERENVVEIIAAVLASVPRAHILVIDDASPDGTGRIADALAVGDSRVHVLHRAGKEGLARAYLAGFAWALRRGYDYVFEFDADFSHDPAYLPGFVAALASGSDVVVGSRRVKGGGVRNWSVRRRMLSWGGSWYARVVLGLGVKDLTGGFNGFRRDALEEILRDGIASTGYCFQIELKYRAVTRGLHVIELPIVFPDRTRGISKMNGSIVKEAIVNVWRIREARQPALPAAVRFADGEDL